MYSERLLDHFRSPRNAGPMEGATAVASAENLGCGDVLKLWVRVEGGVVVAVTFQARGCTATVACGSALTEWLQGRSLATLDSAEVVAGVEEAVGGLPLASRHAARLCGEVVGRIRMGG